MVVAHISALYAIGADTNADGFFRSDDAGKTWFRIDDPAHKFGWIRMLTGAPRIYGRVYLATGGRGIVYGDIAQAPRLPILPGNDRQLHGFASSSPHNGLDLVKVPGRKSWLDNKLSARTEEQRHSCDP